MFRWASEFWRSELDGPTLMNCWQASLRAPALVSVEKQQQTGCISWEGDEKMPVEILPLGTPRKGRNVPRSPHCSPTHGGWTKRLGQGLSGNACSGQGSTAAVPCSSPVVLKPAVNRGWHLGLATLGGSGVQLVGSVIFALLVYT